MQGRCRHCGQPIVEQASPCIDEQNAIKLCPSCYNHDLTYGVSQDKCPEHELERRRAVEAANVALTELIHRHDLSALEWSDVLGRGMRKQVHFGLMEERSGF